ncbi:MAG: VOC family protein [Acidobacteria bacterium]|nr:VOC family protein [Acidobacteriota bacterium]
MTPKAGYYTPLLHVNSIEESMRFYALLGFETIDEMGEPGCLGWARMHCEGGALMFLRAEEPHPLRKRREVLFAMYTPDLPAFREHLRASGVEVPPIGYPEYMPSGTLSVTDPDGYLIDIHHWSQKEHERWEAERKLRLARA